MVPFPCRGRRLARERAAAMPAPCLSRRRLRLPTLPKALYKIPVWPLYHITNRRPC